MLTLVISLTFSLLNEVFTRSFLSPERSALLAFSAFAVSLAVDCLLSSLDLFASALRLSSRFLLSAESSDLGAGAVSAFFAGG